MTDLPHVAARLYGTPLMIARAILDGILGVMAPRLAGRMAFPMGHDDPLETPNTQVTPDGIAIIPVMGSLVTFAVGQPEGLPHLAYGVTKAAANHFSKLLAVEYAQFGIRSNSIVVGMVDTPRIRKTILGAYGGNEEEMIKKRNTQIPLGFMGDAWDVANAALFLASDRARFISGTELVLDGALTATVRS